MHNYEKKSKISKDLITMRRKQGTTEAAKQGFR